MKNIKNKGISLIEILIAVSIIAIISTIVVTNLSKFRNQQVLQNTTEDIVSLLNEARNNTISSKNSNTYGVHFQSDKAILFAGTSFTISPSNKQIDFDSSVLIPTIGGINLGGENDVVFTRISGDTTNNGTIVIQLVNDVTQQKVITISKIGVIGSN